MRNQAQFEFWIRHELHLDLLEPLTCLQESEVSVWLQGRTEQLEMFVKVSGQSAQLENQIGKLLSSFAPGLTPEVLGFNNNLGVVVTRKLEAVNLSLEMDTQIWLEAVSTLAKLQSSSLNFLTELQVPTLDLSMLLESCRALISNTAQLEVLGLNLEQIKQIQNLVPKIAPALEVFEAAGLPNTLVHGDFHANNVMVEHGSPKLIDWSETAISSPLLDLGRFLEFLNRKHLNSHPALAIQTELIEAFFEPWQDQVSRESFFKAARVAPFVATLVFAARAWEHDTKGLMAAYHLRRAARISSGDNDSRQINLS
jgi:Phosphotransferase enzyme family